MDAFTLSLVAIAALAAGSLGLISAVCFCIRRICNRNGGSGRRSNTSTAD